MSAGIFVLQGAVVFARNVLQIFQPHPVHPCGVGFRGGKVPVGDEGVLDHGIGHPKQHKVPLLSDVDLNLAALFQLFAGFKGVFNLV